MTSAGCILVVDDDQELSDGLRVVLEKEGFRVIQARDGQHGKQSTRGLIATGMENHPIVRGVHDIWVPSDVYAIHRPSGESRPRTSLNALFSTGNGLRSPVSGRTQRWTWFPTMDTLPVL